METSVCSAKTAARVKRKVIVRPAMVYWLETLVLTKKGGRADVKVFTGSDQVRQD